MIDLLEFQRRADARIGQTPRSNTWQQRMHNIFQRFETNRRLRKRDTASGVGIFGGGGGGGGGKSGGSGPGGTSPSNDPSGGFGGLA